MDNILSDLKWHKLNISFKSKDRGDIFFTVIQAILKGVYYDTFPNFNWQKNQGANMVFQVSGKKFNYNVNRGETFIVEVMFGDHRDEDIKNFRENLIERMKKRDNTRYYSLEKVSEPIIRNINDINKKEAITRGEICLDYLTPYDLRKTKGKDRTFISKKDFIDDNIRRLKRFFNRDDIDYNSENDDFIIIPHYWNFTEITRRKCYSHAGQLQYINGMIGKLYLRGEFKNFLPFLLLGKEINFGRRFSFGLGHASIYWNSCKHFDRYFPQKEVLNNIVNDILEGEDNKFNSDDFIPVTQKEMDNFVENIYQDISNLDYEFSPNIAYEIRKKSGFKRVVEKMVFKDKVVAKYIQRTVYRTIDRFLKKEAIGFRKGYSRKKALSRIDKAIKNGYVWVLESDIEDFFPSINLDTLKKLIIKSFPQEDTTIKKLIFDMLDTGYIYRNRYIKRERGLAQGNPTSAMFSNLYLDDFDEYIKEFDVELIRYGDDFLILTKSREQAEGLLEETEDFLNDIGLKIKGDKTDIKSIYDDFNFLGYDFTEGEVKRKEKKVDIFKKVLYVTEPYVFLSLSNDHINVKKRKKIKSSIPLRRISEIIILDKATYSTALIKRCNEMGIPITITLNSGYFVTTIIPNRKKYYDLSYLHRKKFDNLTEVEVLEYAKEFAVGKLTGYMTLFFSKKRKLNSDKIIRDIEKYIKKIKGATTVNEILGYEGRIAKQIYRGLNKLIINQQFHIKKRVRKRPDYINSLLNFSSYLIFARINTILRSLGLNPYLGFLHSSNNNYESLVCDIQELFRARLNRFIIKIVNLAIIQGKDFVETDRGYYLTREGKKKFINKFEGEFNKKYAYSRSMKEGIHQQCLMLREWIKDKHSLTIYRWGEREVNKYN